MFRGKGVLVAQGSGVTILGRPRVVEAHAPRERSHSSKDFTWIQSQARCRAGCPVQLPHSSSTPIINSWEDLTKGIQELLSCSPLCGKANWEALQMTTVQCLQCTGMLPKNAWLTASGFLPGSDKDIWKSPQQPQARICSVNSLRKNRCLQRYKETSSERKVNWRDLQECNSSISINNFLEFLWFLSEYLPIQLLQWCFTWDNPGKTKARELLLSCDFSFFSQMTAMQYETKVQEINNSCNQQLPGLRINRNLLCTGRNLTNTNAFLCSLVERLIDCLQEELIVQLTSITYTQEVQSPHVYEGNVWGEQNNWALFTNRSSLFCDKYRTDF